MTPLIALPAASGTGLPELPALSRLLQQATRLPGSGSWRSGVLDALRVADPAGVSPARVAACALPALQPGNGLCMAIPVHAVAGISRMFLAPAGSLVMDAGEREAWRVAFNLEFGSEDVQLHAVAGGWLLEAPFAAAADDPDPDLIAGAALAREPATTPAAKSMRRLGVEVEMWLAGAKANRERERRGLPPVNSFWFWGGTAFAQVAQPAQRPDRLYSNTIADAWLGGLAALCGASLQEVQGWQAVDGPASVVILQPPALADMTALLSGWDSDWFAPALRDLETRKLPALRLQIGESAWQLPAPRLARWFRRQRPWWEAVSA